MFRVQGSGFRVLATPVNLMGVGVYGFRTLGLRVFCGFRAFRGLCRVSDSWFKV